jgi:L-threonylcarbamoyladenylate synthase
MSSPKVRNTVVAATNPEHDAEQVRRAAGALRAGQIVAIPTDTVYGLAAALDRPDAIDRLYAIKGRPAEKAIPVLISDWKQVESLTPRLSAMEAHLARTFWPGALTLVLQARPGLPQGVTTLTSNAIQTVAVRVPDNGLARAIIAAAGGALAVTSANRSGASPAVDALEVSEFGLSQPLLVIDGGRAPGGVPSTIVQAADGTLQVLREGAIPASAIAAALSALELPPGDHERARYDQHMNEQPRSNASAATR